jgi:indole-3-glycerol phosphate synthase
LDDLTEARASCGLPVLRKDFTLDRYHLLQASAAGADCVLLIVAALTDQELSDLLAQAKEFELDVLVEVHNEAELERALALDANVIGVNNRNLKTLEVDLETSLRLAPLIPDRILRVSESGIRTADDIKRLSDVGYSAFLIGESLMKQADPGGALAKLLQV